MRDFPHDCGTVDTYEHVHFYVNCGGGLPASFNLVFSCELTGMINLIKSVHTSSGRTQAAGQTVVNYFIHFQSFYTTSCFLSIHIFIYGAIL